MKVAACHTCDGGPALVRARGSSSFDLGEIDERAQKACSMLHACAVHAPEPSCVVTTTALAPAFQGNMLWMQPKLPAKLARIRAFHETCAEFFWHFGIEGKLRNHLRNLRPRCPCRSRAPPQGPRGFAKPAFVMLWKVFASAGPSLQ